MGTIPYSPGCRISCTILWKGDGLGGSQSWDLKKLWSVVSDQQPRTVVDVLSRQLKTISYLWITIKQNTQTGLGTPSNGYAYMRNGMSIVGTGDGLVEDRGIDNERLRTPTGLLCLEINHDMVIGIRSTPDENTTEKVCIDSDWTQIRMSHQMSDLSLDLVVRLLDTRIHNNVCVLVQTVHLVNIR